MTNMLYACCVSVSVVLFSGCSGQCGLLIYWGKGHHTAAGICLMGCCMKCESDLGTDAAAVKHWTLPQQTRLVQ